MKRERLVELNRLAVIRLCHSALDSRVFRQELLHLLQRVIPFDYAYFSTTDPATQLGTSTVISEQPPSWCMSVYLENEFLQEDFNKFSQMVRHKQAVGVLSQAAGNDLHHSHRYREMLVPMGLEDELRAVFVTASSCWGTLCLHRETSSYTAVEAACLFQLTQHIADGLRKAALLSGIVSATIPDGPGVLILSEAGEFIAATAAAEYWLAELTDMAQADRHALPIAVRSVVAGLKAVEMGRTAADITPKVRLRTRSGSWLVLYASRLRGRDSQGQISVIFEVAQPAEIAPMIMQAYNLTKREGDVTQFVLRGASTTEIAAQLHISPHTVQDHLKAIFDKVDVGSRGELAARLFIQQHQA